LREKILKKMDLTEDKLKAMPPEQRAAIEDEIAQKIKEYLLTHKSDQQQKQEARMTVHEQPTL
jgi:hypothetical protein